MIHSIAIAHENNSTFRLREQFVHLGDGGRVNFCLLDVNDIIRDTAVRFNPIALKNTLIYNEKKSHILRKTMKSENNKCENVINVYIQNVCELI